MTVNLTTYKQIQSNLFVRIDLGTGTIWRFSDRLTAYTLNGESYTAAGNLMGVSETNSDLKNPENEVTITLAGIPNNALTDILAAKLKGSEVQIYRVLFNATTDIALAIAGNPAGRFTGIVSNYSLSEEFDTRNRSASNTISIVCSSVVNIMANTMKGRRTNPEDMKKLYPTDVSFDRVPGLVNTYFDFGIRK